MNLVSEPRSIRLGMARRGDGPRAGTMWVLLVALVAALLTVPVADGVARADEHVTEPPLTVGDVGPHAVGHATTSVSVAHRDEPLPVDVWYPADPAAAAEADALAYAFEIDLDLLLPGGDLLSFALPSPFATVEPAVAEGSFPLVVFSHGNGGTRFQSFFLTERLASFGFVVVSPDHVGNTFTDLLGDAPTPPEIEAGQRPLDVSGLIDAAEAGEVIPEILHGTVDTDRVGVAGHSFGGYTALAAAGGNDLVGVAPDQRIDAIVPLAPAVFPELLADEQLQSMTVPTLFIGGTLDSTTPIEPNVGRAVGLMASDPLYRLDLEDAGHFTFADVCAIGTAVAAELGPLADLFLPQLPGWPETCDGSRLSPAVAHPLIARATAGFLIEQLADGIDPTAPPVDVPAPPFADEVAGPFAIGKTTVEVDVPHREDDLPVEVWYPADADSAAAAEPSEYSLTVAFGTSSVTLTQPSPNARAEPLIAADAGPFPLVVFSHGSGGIRFQSLFLAEALASHGYVVIAPDHLGNTFGEMSGNPVADRPRDVSALIDAVEAGVLAPDLLGDAVDDRVAVTGHSFGGYTSIAAAAGNPLVTFDADPRVDAIVPIAPASGPSLLADEVVAGLTTPTLFIGGTADDVTPIAPNIDRVIGLMASEVVYRVDVEDAGHYSFSDVCDFADAIAAQAGPLAGLILGILPGYPESCDGSLRDISEVQEVTVLATVGFLDEQLGGPGGPTVPGVPIDFADVPADNVHRAAILALAADGVMVGDEDGNFRPRAAITRAQLASVVARAMGLEEAAGVRFPDAVDSVHAGAIEALASAGVVEGFGDGTFRPNRAVSRGQVASMLARWLELADELEGPFLDVDGSVHRGAIHALAAIGVVNGTSPTTFEPGLDMSRAQLASVVQAARVEAR